MQLTSLKVTFELDVEGVNTRAALNEKPKDPVKNI
jgi:hypothetical protein